MARGVEFCRIVNLHTFRCSVVVLCGDLDGVFMRRAFAKEKRRVMAPASAPSYDDVVSDIRKETRTYQGVTCVNRDTADCYVYLPEWKSEVFVHEAYHAVRGIMRFRDMEEDPSTELGAYLIEHLFCEVVNTDLADGNFVRRRR